MAKPRLLLIGTPGAGKTSLLGALAQAAATQSPILKGQLADPDGAWERVQKNTYAGKTTVDGAESYTLYLQSTQNGRHPVEASIADPDGTAAMQILKARKPPFDMDALLLTVDVSLSGKELIDEFQQYARWLNELRKARARRTEIGELPVYLVLTKCDLLAKKEDTFVRWMQRIEQAKRQVDERFREFNKHQGAGFGTVHLQLWATAIKRPALADRPAKAQEPFGVAELFRQCLQSARDFQERRHTSQSRLHNVVVGAIGIVAILALAVALMVEFRPPLHHSRLDEKVQAVLPKEDAKLAERLQGSIKKLEEKNEALTAIESDADFRRLPDATREAVTKYHAELKQYLQASEDSLVLLKLPYLAKNQDEFKEMQKSALSFKLPSDHAKAWEETRLAKRVRHVRQEYESLHAALAGEETWMRGRIDADTVLLKQGAQIYGKLLNRDKLGPQEVEAWQKQYREHMNPKPLVPREDMVPGVTRLTYEDLGKFEQVQKAKKDWDASKRKLTTMAKQIEAETR
ncbi:MAG TPA: hypothetical protein VFE62_28135 [Gemmataceae bacterium]|nr:hypothetical protein [Gemmataceae bacterium]